MIFTSMEVLGHMGLVVGMSSFFIIIISLAIKSSDGFLMVKVLGGCSREAYDIRSSFVINMPHGLQIKMKLNQTIVRFP